MIKISVSSGEITQNSRGFRHALSLDPEIPILPQRIFFLDFVTIDGGRFLRTAVTGSGGFTSFWFYGGFEQN